MLALPVRLACCLGEWAVILAAVLSAAVPPSRPTRVRDRQPQTTPRSGGSERASNEEASEAYHALPQKRARARVSLSPSLSLSLPLSLSPSLSLSPVSMVKVHVMFCWLGWWLR